MSTLDRLTAEAVPTRPAPAPKPCPWSQQQQDQHWHDLCHAVGTPNAKRPTHTQPNAA
ncbi:hypothetical protein [Streptomyces parvulus]|uniref:hypothetical protein n=1 Tax=Streptomyces parvulus TaxID=146923 RepID=UPI0037161081